MYAFVRNNPFRYTDYAGLFSVLFTPHTNTLDDDYRPYRPLSEPNFSSLYEVGSKELISGKVYIHNGINTNLEQAKQHAIMLSNLGGGVKVTGIHNQTHTAPIDVIECLFAAKFMPTRASFLTLQQMNNFHRTHPPDAKMFMTSHSGGSIQVKNALLMASNEVRNRVVSLAIAPGAIIPRELCFKSFSYGTYLDPVVWSAIYNDPFHAREIQFLKSNPSAPRFDHSFNSPTYTDVLTQHTNDFIKNSGGYK